MIENIVFDLGRVLVKFEPMEYLRETYTNKEAENLFINIFGSSEWLDLDRGVITNEEAIEKISNRLPDYKKDISEIMKNWINILSPITGTIEIVKALVDKSYRMTMLSNFHEDAFSHLYEKHEFFQYFENIIVSSDVFLIKPEKEIFQYMCDNYSINPATSIFIDDNHGNIDAAKEMNFQTILFENPTQLRQELISKYNINI